MEQKFKAGDKVKVTAPITELAKIGINPARIADMDLSKQEVSYATNYNDGIMRYTLVSRITVHESMLEKR